VIGWIFRPGFSFIFMKSLMKTNDDAQMKKPMLQIEGDADYPLRVSGRTAQRVMDKGNLIPSDYGTHPGFASRFHTEA
jgi:hypothetical protein